MICIHVCSRDEWVAAKKILDINIENVKLYPYGEYFEHRFHNKDAVIYFSGATKTRSSGACQYAIDNWEPELLFVAGTSGGVGESLKKLDIVIADKTVQYDVIVKFGAEIEFFYSPMITPIDNGWINFEGISEKLHKGLVATADMDMSYENIHELRKEGVLVADWESGAIAKIAELNGVKCCILRGVSDIPQSIEINDTENQGNDYVKNTPLIMEKLLKIVIPEILEQL